MDGLVIALIVILVVVIFIMLISSVKIVRQSTAVVVERLGKFNRVLHTGGTFNCTYN